MNERFDERQRPHTGLVNSNLMDWKNGSDQFTPYFASPPPQSSSALLFNYNNYNFAVEAKRRAVEAEQGVDQKKKRLSEDQLKSLERSFEEDQVKLDHDRKMKLSKELELQPRQIAVWFQNRRARWKAKQLEHLYDTLKQDFDTISKEKHNLQLEVMKLRSMLREQVARNQASMANTNVSGEEATESTSVGVGSCEDYMFNVENVNQISSSSTPPFWWGVEAAAHLPSYPSLFRP